MTTPTHAPCAMTTILFFRQKITSFVSCTIYSMSTHPPTEKTPQQDQQKDTTEEEEEILNARIEKTGCAQENEDLQLCFYDKRDWRLCKDEMQQFRQCFTAKSSNAGSRELQESERTQQ
ncbi:unnamed protein product [Absidia cylindrospora]